MSKADWEYNLGCSTHGRKNCSICEGIKEGTTDEPAADWEAVERLANQNIDSATQKVAQAFIAMREENSWRFSDLLVKWDAARRGITELKASQGILQAGRIALAELAKDQGEQITELKTRVDKITGIAGIRHVEQIAGLNERVEKLEKMHLVEKDLPSYDGPEPECTCVPCFDDDCPKHGWYFKTKCTCKSSGNREKKWNPQCPEHGVDQSVCICRPWGDGPHDPAPDCPVCNPKPERDGPVMGTARPPEGAVPIEPDKPEPPEVDKFKTRDSLENYKPEPECTCVPCFDDDCPIHGWYFPKIKCTCTRHQGNTVYRLDDNCPIHGKKEPKGEIKPQWKIDAENVGSYHRDRYRTPTPPDEHGTPEQTESVTADSQDVPRKEELVWTKDGYDEWCVEQYDEAVHGDKCHLVRPDQIDVARIAMVALKAIMADEEGESVVRETARQALYAIGTTVRITRRNP